MGAAQLERFHVVSPVAATTLQSLHADQTPVTVGVVHLVQALNHVGWDEQPHVWLVTRDTQTVVEGDAERALARSTV